MDYFSGQFKTKEDKYKHQLFQKGYDLEGLLKLSNKAGNIISPAGGVNGINYIVTKYDTPNKDILELIQSYETINFEETQLAISESDTELSTSVKTNVEVEANYYTSKLLKANPNKIYVFGDNNQRQGKKGQASVRDEANAMGISTKLRPSADEDAFMTDNQIKANAAIIDSDIAKIKATGKTVVFPKDGLGTGLAALKSKAPNTYEYLVIRLKEEFGFDNNTGTLVVSLREAFGKSTQPQSDSFYNLKDFTNEERVIILDTMIAKKMSADKNKALIQIEAELLKNKESTIEFLKSCLT